MGKTLVLMYQFISYRLLSSDVHSRKRSVRLKAKTSYAFNPLLLKSVQHQVSLQ